MPRIRKKADEHLSEQNVEKVISLLEQTKPITKKEACAILNISYNTTRLNNIVLEHKSAIKLRADLRKKFRNTPLTKDDEKTIVSSYLMDESLDSISNSIYRSVAHIKRVLNKWKIPFRNASINYWNPVLVSIEAMQDDYKKDDLVYSARYNQPACISKKIKDEIYRIWLYKDCQYALQPYYELSDLRQVQTELGVVIEDIPKEEIQQLLYEGFMKAKRKSNENR